MGAKPFAIWSRALELQPSAQAPVLEDRFERAPETPEANPALFCQDRDQRCRQGRNQGVKKNSERSTRLSAKGVLPESEDSQSRIAFHDAGGQNASIIPSGFLACTCS